jgi:hypothetical protein
MDHALVGAGSWLDGPQDVVGAARFMTRWNLDWCKDWQREARAGRQPSLGGGWGVVYFELERRVGKRRSGGAPL